MFSCLCCLRGLQVHQVDVNNDFLKGDLSEEVYMRQPDGFQQVGSHGEPLVCRLKKAGLRQAPRNWFNKLCDYLCTLAFVPSRADNTFSARISSNDVIYVAIYVDDILVTGSSESCVQQRKHVEELLRKSGMESVSAVDTPISVSPKLSKINSGEPGDAHQYRSAIESLLYHILRYLKGTLDFGLWIAPQQLPLVLKGFSNADWASDPDDRFKHVDLDVYFVREKVLGHYVPAQFQVADVLTKPLAAYAMLSDATLRPPFAAVFPQEDRLLTLIPFLRLDAEKQLDSVGDEIEVNNMSSQGSECVHPKEKGRDGSRFGFVKVGNKVEAERVKERLNGLMVYGSRISVSFAKYYLKVQMDKGASNVCASRKEVFGHVDEDEVNKPRRCLVGVMASVCSVRSIVDRLHAWSLGDIKVQRLRGKSFLFIIEDKDLFLMLEDLQWSYLKEIFVDVMLWTESIFHKERVVWLEIDSLPLHCWNVVTLKRLVGLWGKFEAFGENVSHHLDCEKVNMLISTSSEARIDEVVDVVVENRKFVVRVLEVRMLDNSLVNLSISEVRKKKEIEVEKVGVVVDNEDVSQANLDAAPSEASESGSSYEKIGSPFPGCESFDVACFGDNLADRKKVSGGKPIKVGCGFDEDSLVVKPSSARVLNIEVGVLEEASDVGSPDIGLLQGLGLQAEEFMDSSNSIIKENSGIEHVEGACEDVSLFPYQFMKKKKKVKKFGSLLDIQGKVLSKAERRMRDRALKSAKVKKSDLLASELSGTSLSDSDLKKRWDAAYFEAEETLAAAKLLGIKFAGHDSKVIEEFVSFEMS
ncbi:hypothetical protein F3Y22_tig00001732pilonHSYRG00047 [Hibiscus syriacus]|uniref:Reverse transcriptase Ty1/copia-type domain-containing protein n=1 Tax=Hibiscus syriacus TaxID=106335 RepID=A0A6A3CU16_HIBSY|nr:hypothetical protein F3Y22_tig00001732pilonHSYRG00047 [Hibiscus syriacus]